MLIEKYDKAFRDKINDMQSVPDNFVFNPSAKWQQIENKLIDNKQKPKITWWYWAAASIAIFIATSFWLSNSKSTNDYIKSNTTISTLTYNSNTKKKNQILAQVAQKKTATVATKTIAVNNATLINESMNTESVIENIAATTIQPSTNITVDSNATLTISTNVATKIPVIKPKRKVIHINELGMPLLEPESITKRDDKHIAPQEEQTTPIETNKSWWLFKPKPTTVNTFTNTSLTDNK